MAVEFCKKCGGLMVPQRLKTKTVIACRSCSNKRDVGSKEKFKIGEKLHKRPEDTVVVLEKDPATEILPKTKIQCPKCEHNIAYWWIQQTRSADEAPTRFYQCANTKCGNKWREYD